MKPRKENETDAQYIARLEAANASLRDHNKRLSQWGESTNRAVTMLSVEGSLVFQAMAEKAGVRSHPSVSKAVELFDAIAHPQWTREDAVFPKVEWPQDWQFDSPAEWSGDADMALNSPIADAIDYMRSRLIKASEAEREWIYSTMSRLEAVLQSRVEGFKEAHGFRPVKLTAPPPKHYRDMTTDELRDLCSAIGWALLDVAQDMSFANEMLRRDLRAATYRRVCADLYALSNMAIEPREDTGFDVKVLGGEEVPF